jgi:hypothetical protein
MPARQRYMEVKQSVAWMNSNANVSEFWNTFIRAIPTCPRTPEAATHIGDLSFNVSCSLDLHKVSAVGFME